MGTEKVTPYKCHLFVCINDRGGRRKSCADGNSQQVRKKLKEEVKNRKWEKDVRISSSLCLGICASGPNVVIYPHKILFTEVTITDIGRIIDKITYILDEKIE